MPNQAPAAERSADQLLGEDSGPQYKHRFTVFTPTYNRAGTLDRVYTSLKNQTFRDFEWIIVDDGSADETASLVQAWQREADFPVRYVYQPNRGKHVAFNRGVAEARGELFLTLDSDDACVPTALERFKYYWDSIPAEKKAGFSAVTALCVDQHNKLVGDPYPRNVIDSHPLEIIYRYRVKGEKWGFQRTDVLKEHPFPEDVTRQYIPEGTIWAEIGRKYKTRYVNEPLRIYFIEGPSMVHGQGAARNALGGRMENLIALNGYLSYFKYSPLAFARSACLYSRFSFHLGISVRAQRRKLNSLGARLLWATTLPVGLLLYIRDSRTS